MQGRASWLWHLCHIPYNLNTHSFAFLKLYQRTIPPQKKRKKEKKKLIDPCEIATWQCRVGPWVSI